jgi:hypothetical protein
MRRMRLCYAAPSGVATPPVVGDLPFCRTEPFRGRAGDEPVGGAQGKPESDNERSDQGKRNEEPASHRRNPSSLWPCHS